MRFQTRGPEIGRCNLCGDVAKLTEDHIPPKGVPRVGQAQLMSLIDMLGADRPRKSQRLFQAGVTFRSICRPCNNERLGGKYDPALVNLCKLVHESLGTRVYLPIEVPLQPNFVARSVVGHLLAHDLDSYRRGPVLEELTDFFVDEAALFPSSLQLHYWLFPYNEQVVTNAAAGFFDFRYQQEPLLFLLFKFYPLAFMITQGALPPVGYLVSRLDTSLSAEPAASTRLVIPTSGLPPRRWPEAPTDHGAIMHTKGAAGASRLSL